MLQRARKRLSGGQAGTFGLFETGAFRTSGTGDISGTGLLVATVVVGMGEVADEERFDACGAVVNVQPCAGADQSDRDVHPAGGEVEQLTGVAELALVVDLADEASVGVVVGGVELVEAGQ